MNIRAYIGQKEFEQINCLTVNKRFAQVISVMSFKFCNNTSPPYMNDVLKAAGEPNTTTNHGHNNVFYIAPIILKNLLNSL